MTGPPPHPPVDSRFLGYSMTEYSIFSICRGLKKHYSYMYKSVVMDFITRKNPITDEQYRHRKWDTPSPATIIH